MNVGALCARYSSEYPRANHAVLARLQSDPVARIKAPGKAKDYIDFCRRRRGDVAPSTVLQDIVCIRGVLAYAKPAWDMQDVTDAPIREAWPLLRKQGLVGGSKRRIRIPSPAETAGIIGYWLARATDVPMPDIVEFQGDSGRRISETLRLLWSDLDETKQTILVRDMKHPRRKLGNHKWVALPDKSFEIILRQPRRSTAASERIFPYPQKTVQRMYHQAVVALGYDDLRLHDSRRGTVTKLLAEGRTPQEIMLVTGQETVGMVMTTYNGMKAEDFHKRRTA